MRVVLRVFRPLKHICALLLLAKPCDYYLINLEVWANKVFYENFQKSVDVSPVSEGGFVPHIPFISEKSRWLIRGKDNHGRIFLSSISTILDFLSPILSKSIYMVPKSSYNVS